MGLDISIRSAHSIGKAGSYSVFGEFRVWLAEKIGVKLLERQGFGGEMAWEDLLQHPLYAFINHSDCDGELTTEECEKTLQGMKDVKKNLTDGEDEPYMLERLSWWIGLLTQAVDEGGEVIFH